MAGARPPKPTAKLVKFIEPHNVIGTNFRIFSFAN